ncbi:MULTISPECIES: hypothetical protein [Stenotrophomonas]|uniref:Transmembrane protein n=1 Tax=Stenotrophomonas maltophilia TaxID=40324 RepID=A0A3S0HYB4_STEMA|nr:hypothetical protein [Stenotrophomonas maltophilia]RTQ90532.1 hypothetical protein EKL94_06365 [Stenotrophomonas maltophilia]
MSIEQSKASGSRQSSAEWMAARFASLAGGLAVIYAYSYLLGYAYLTFYFTDLRAVWAVDLFDITTIAQTPAVVAALLATTLASLVLHGDPLPVPPIRVAGALALLAIATYAIHLAVSKWMNEYTSYWSFCAFVLALISALMGGLIYLRKLRDSLGRKLGAWTFVLSMGALALVATPAAANIRTRAIIDSRAQSLAIVHFENSQDQTWRLLRAISGSHLLLIRAANGDNFDFRIVESVQVTSIGRGQPKGKSASKSHPHKQ